MHMYPDHTPVATPEVMLSPLHLGGRNYTCTETKLSKILIIFAPYPPPGVNLWFQGNGSHLEAGVRQRAYHFE
jgi:hypothetical protein